MAMSLCRGSRSLTGRPSMLIVPDVTSSRPATMRSAVVLPQPDGPTSTRISPSPTARSREFTATVPSANRLVTESSSIRDTLALSLLSHAKGQAPDQVPLEDQVHDDRREGADQGAGHQRGDARGA